VIVARGARAVEALVLAEVAELAAEARREPALLGRPVVVVVPSGSLRAHLAERLVQVCGAVAGVEIVTLHKLAHDVLAAAGEPERRGAPLLGVLVQRAARREPALAGFLEPLADGYAGIAGTVRDLLDAGLEAAHADALDERFAELLGRGDDAALARARAIVRVAAAVHAELESLGAGRSSTLLRRATELLLQDPDRALPARAVLVHGFAEATGLATDVIEALVRRRAARVFVDEPPDPAAAGRPDTGAAFARRLRERLAGYAATEDQSGDADLPGTGTVSLRRAPGTLAEARAVAADIRELIDAGARPESIGVVARALAAFQLALHQHFDRLAIPYSVVGAPGLRGPASRHVEAVAALLAAGGAAPVDAWLDVAFGAGGAAVGDLRLALRVLGAATVAEVAAMPLEERLGGAMSLALPVRRGFEAPDEGGGSDEDIAQDEPQDDAEDERAWVPARRRVTAARLERAVVAAGDWCRAWSALPAHGTMQSHAAALRRLLDGVARSRPGGGGDGEVREALAGLVAELPGKLALERQEVLDLLREAIRPAGLVVPGGSGAGVQVLGVVDARGRTFSHLFVLGVNRDVFPRPVREDWLLPDRLRAALLPLLPDIPLKRTGHDEERYLFAQLLSAAPAVTVSWTECDDDGAPTPASALVERLCQGDHDRVPLLHDLYAPGGVGDRALRPAHEHAVLAGLRGSRARFAGVLPIALPVDEGGPVAAAVAAARVAVLDELDPDRRSAAGRQRAMEPSPYFGFVGVPPARGADPRAGEVWVTALEALARCPWRSFLERLLRLEPVPDAGAELPPLAGTLLGSVVHRALERVAGGPPGEAAPALAELSASRARNLPWPDLAEIERILAAAAGEALREEGLALPLLVRAMAERARPFLDAAHLVDFAGDGAVAVAGAEVVGGVTVSDASGRQRRIAFRADRVDAVGGALRLTDFKTGKGLTSSSSDEKKRSRLLQAIGAGEWLQAAAYAAAGGEVVAGRYVFLRPDTPDGARAIVAGADRELLEAFRAAVVELLALRDAGAFFPRLVTRDGGKENPECPRCPVREACLAGDSGARRRLLAWAPGAGLGDAGDPQVHAAGRAWRLGDGGGEPGGEGST
jgi:hypothetical protein